MSQIMSRRLFYGYFFAGAMTYVFYYLGGIEGSMKFLGGILMYFFIFYAIYWFAKLVFGREAIGFFHFFIIYLYKLSVFLSFALLIGGGFTYYHNSLNPAKMPLYTIGNGEKNIRFQAMSHIAQGSFYQEVQNQVTQAKDEGYVLFYEGVRSGNDENKEIFDKALGVKITPDLYENFSKIYGVEHQDNTLFLNIKNDLDFNTDLDIDEIVSLYLEKIPKEQAQKYLPQHKAPELKLGQLSGITIEPEETIDINTQVLEQLSQLNEKQLMVLKYINKSLLNLIIKNEGLRNYILTKLGNQDLFSVILDDRNTHIIAEIQNSKYNNIFVMYGLMHFHGILKGLQEQDPNWQILEVEYHYPISDPIPLGIPEISL